MLISRGLDLSINGVLGLSGIVSALVVVNTGSVALAVAAGLGTGAGVALINALLIVKVRINAFIATIGTLFVFSGVAYLITDGQAVTTTKTRQCSWRHRQIRHRNMGDPHSCCDTAGNVFSCRFVLAVLTAVLRQPCILYRW